MWVFDGEEWVEEGAQKPRPSDPSVRVWDEAMPELQVIESIPVPSQRSGYVPPLPMP